MTTGLFDTPTGPLALEKELWSSGCTYVAGVDEAGRGALAGPVVAAAVIMTRECDDLCGEIRDSKKLTFERRESLFPVIEERAISVGVGVIETNEIDTMNILQASLRAMAVAIDLLTPKPGLCLIDGNQRVPTLHPQRLIIKGDERILSIGAASIVAKVTRDRIMIELADKYPQYGFTKNKGYGTADHLNAIRKIGPCEVHRKSFSLPTPP